MLRGPWVQPVPVLLSPLLAPTVAETALCPLQPDPLTGHHPIHDGSSHGGVTLSRPERSGRPEQRDQVRPTAGPSPLPRQVTAPHTWAPLLYFQAMPANFVFFTSDCLGSCAPLPGKDHSWGRGDISSLCPLSSSSGGRGALAAFPGREPERAETDAHRPI